MAFFYARVMTNNKNSANFIERARESINKMPPAVSAPRAAAAEMEKENKKRERFVLAGNKKSPVRLPNATAMLYVCASVVFCLVCSQADHSTPPVHSLD
jgi:hypothetical protein